MTKTLYTILFICLFLTGFTLYDNRVDITTEYSNQNTKYNSILRESCNSVVSEAVNNMLINENEGIFYLYKTETQRATAVETFYTTLAKNFNHVRSTNYNLELEMKMPVICLIDSNGFYICYNQPYDDPTYGLCTKNIISPINTWAYTSKDEKFLIQFFVGKPYEVTVMNCESGEVQEGYFEYIYEYFLRPEGLKDFKSKDDFAALRNEVIIGQTTDKLEYYINQYNFAVQSISGQGNEYGLHYTLELPRADGNDWAGLLDQPGCIAFIQGMQIKSSIDYMNVYSMRGTETVKGQYFAINESNGIKTYHKLKCSEINIDGDDIKFQTSMEECAKAGAYPCAKCIP